MINKKVNLLITGGAGFIGSNLVRHFLQDERIGLVRVLDNLSNGYLENIKDFLNHPRFEFCEGDIRDFDTCLKACEGIDKVSHQAALGSVPRSIENPMLSTEVNVLGTVNLMYAAVQQNVDRIVLAFSSSTYGDHTGLPKVEERIGKPLSPYAVTKSAIEQYADVFGKTYGLNWIGLRYFNVFGPKQNPDNPYAAVLPIFIKRALSNLPVEIYGDGKTTRDFTYVENVILANDLSLFTNRDEALNQVYNTACGEEISLNEIVTFIGEYLDIDIEVKYRPKRKGDIDHSLANIDKSSQRLGYKVVVPFYKGLEMTIKHFLIQDA